MSFFGSITRAAKSGVHAATGMAGKVTPGVPRAVSGAVGKVLPSAMRAPKPVLGLVDRIGVARGVSTAVAKAEQLSGRSVGVNPNFRFARPKQVKRFW
jgi:hypothetical protein